MLPVRIKFCKTGLSKYISHLDLQRSVLRALSRSGIKFAFTEGFNPHLRIVFSMPLSMYQESECEFFDVTMTENLPLNSVAENFRKVFPTGIEIREVTLQGFDPNSIRFAQNEIVLDTEHSFDEKIISPMIIDKKTKSGIKPVDIFPMIKSADCEISNGKTVIELTADCSPQSYLNPALFLKFFGLTDNVISIKRLRFFDESLVEIK